MVFGGVHAVYRQQFAITQMVHTETAALRETALI